MSRTRCAWATTNELLSEYHDAEWGDVSRDDRYLFEMLNLEGAQAGLSWLTVLKKRANYRRAFAEFDAVKLLKFSPARREKLVLDAGLIRHPGKIAAVFDNAEAFLETQKEFGSFAEFVWSFDDAAAMSKALKTRSFRFVGPTICYAFMQAVGVVNDHSADCFKR